MDQLQALEAKLLPHKANKNPDNYDVEPKDLNSKDDPTIPKITKPKKPAGKSKASAKPKAAAAKNTSKPTLGKRKLIQFYTNK